jgi:hypothetical protein
LVGEKGCYEEDEVAVTDDQLTQETLNYTESTSQLPWFHIVTLRIRRESSASFITCKDIIEEATP